MSNTANSMRLCCALIVGIYICTPQCFAQTPAVWSKTAGEMRVAWDRYSERARSLQGVCYETISDESAKKLKRKSSQTFLQKGNNFRWQYQAIEGGPQYAEVIARNERYGFKMERKDNDARWAVSDIAADPKLYDQDAKQLSAYFSRLPFDFIIPASLPVTILDNSLIINSSRTEEIEGMKTLRVVFILPPEKAKRSGIGIVSGVVYYNVDRAWSIQKIESKSNWGEPTTEVFSYTYDNADPAFPIVKSIVIDRHFSQKKQHIQRRFDFDLVERVPNDEDFTFSAFGLPELVNQTPPPRSWYSQYTIWIFVGVVLFLAIGFAYRKRRLLAEKQASS